MADINELTAIVFDLLDAVDLYKHQVNDLHYDNTFKEFNFSRGIKNYDKINKQLKSVDLPGIDENTSKTMNIDDFKKYFEYVLKIILGSDFEEDIKIAQTFIKPVKYSFKSDVKTSYKKIAGVMTPCEFIISDKTNQIQLCQVINSEITVLLKPLYNHFASTISNLNYQYIPGIIAAYIAICELSGAVMEPNLISEYEKFYISNDVAYASDSSLDIIELMPKYRHADLIDFHAHNKFSYLISDIYSTSLIKKYFDDPISFLNRFRMMIKGEISIPQYLDYYGLSLTNKEVVLTYQNKVEEVEKKYGLKKQINNG